MRDARDALDHSTADPREWLQAKAVKASWAAHDAELDVTPIGWKFDAFFAGWDEQLPGAELASSE